ncbi:MAG: DUF4082 domain-containing protein [Sedimentisphaerales bacterium]|nr:DUF4082 domain-containing protein [Sedimentisphaerales bacterium]
MKTLFLAPIILVLLAWTASVSADPTPAIADFEGVSSARVADCCTLGWEFTLTQDITVTHLGIYDYDDDNGFDSHDIGLWQVSDEALLTSGTVNWNNEPDGDGFRYDDVEDVLLTAGPTYVVAFYVDWSGSDDEVVTSVSTITIDPVVTIGDVRYEVDIFGSDITFPTETHGGYRIGPNFLFETSGSDIPSGGEVPEPASMVLVSIGLMTSLVKLRKSGNR